MKYISYILGGCGFLSAGVPEIGSNSQNWSLLAMIGQFFFLAAIFVLIIILAVYSLRLAARFKNYSGGNNNLRLIETRALGTQNFVHLIKAGNKYIVVGSSKENITFLTELDSQSVSDVLDTSGRESFDSRLSEQIKNLFKRDIPPEE